MNDVDIPALREHALDVSGGRRLLILAAADEIERLQSLEASGDLRWMPDEQIKVMAAEILRLREVLGDLVVATDPYVDDASPQEQMDEHWIMVFAQLMSARKKAHAALGE